MTWWAEPASYALRGGAVRVAYPLGAYWRLHIALSGRYVGQRTGRPALEHETLAGLAAALPAGAILMVSDFGVMWERALWTPPGPLAPEAALLKAIIRLEREVSRYDPLLGNPECRWS